MPEPSLFRHYQIVQDADGNNVEVVRNDEQVAVLAFDTRQLEFVHCHVVLEALAERSRFEQACRSLQEQGHPLLARLVDFGEDDGSPFYITGNVDGETLRHYLTRLQDLPAWLGVSVTCRALDAMLALYERGDFATRQPLDSLRVVQTAAQTVQVGVADFRILGNRAPAAGGKAAFDKQAKLLKAFFQEHIGNSPAAPEQAVPGTDLAELLGACLSSASTHVTAAVRDLRAALLKLVPDDLSGEIATASKPRPLVAPLLASYQDVARAVVNLVRIQSQRLDMANPYAMRGTLTKTGRAVLVEQVPPARLVGNEIAEADRRALLAGQKNEPGSVVKVVLLQESADLTCLAEEAVEGISVGDLLKERHCLTAHEGYLVLAALDSALAEVDESNSRLRKIRLEDVFLLTGLPREDSRTAKLLLTKLNQWPTFSLVVRAHPTLASMAGRGLDPAVFLPQDAAGATSAKKTQWHGGWLAATARLLLGLDRTSTLPANAAGGAREREMMARCFDEELRKCRDGKPSTRSDFLARYARLIHHHDSVKPTPEPVANLVETARPSPSRQRTVPVTKAKKDAPPAALTSPPIVLASTDPMAAEKPTIGFAELLFRGAGEEASNEPVHEWTKTAEDAPPTIHPREALLPPKDYVPLWLRAAVFIGGSMVIGAVIAHLTGGAIWQKLPRTPTKSSTKAPASGGTSEGQPATQPKSEVPGDTSTSPTTPKVEDPVLPPDTSAGAGGLELRPPARLRDLMIEPPRTPAPN